MSTAPHLWRKLLDARATGARLVVVDPFRSRTARVADEHLRPLPGTDAALAIGMMRAIVDAGLQDEEWCRAHADGYEELLERAGRTDGRATAPRSAAFRREDIARVGREFASTRPALLRLGVGAQRHIGAPTAYSTIASLPALTGAWRDRGGGCSYIPLATAAAVTDYALKREDLRPGPVRTINMSQLGRGAHRRRARPAGEGVRLLELEPGGDRARPGARAGGAAPRRPVRGRAGAVHDRHRRARRRGAPRDDAAGAPRRPVLLGPSLPDLERAGDRAAAARPSRTPRRSGSWPRGWASTTRASRDSDEELVDALLAGFEEGDCGARLAKIDLGQGPTPHADGRLRDRDRQADAARGLPAAGRGGGRGLAERFPLAMITPKTHLFLNSTFANQAASTRRSPRPRSCCSPADAAPRGVADGGQVRVFNDRGSFACAVRVSDDARPGRAGGPDGLVERGLRGRPQRTGDHLAGADRAGPRADLQRQPCRGRGALAADQPVVLLRLQHAPHRLVQAPARHARRAAPRAARPSRRPAGRPRRPR